MQNNLVVSYSKKFSYGTSFKVAIYICYLLLLIKISNSELNQLYVLIGLFPLTFGACDHLLRRGRLNHIFTRKMYPMLCLFSFYFVLSTFNIGEVQRGISYCLIFLFHIAIIKKFLIGKRILIEEYVFSFLLVSVFAVFLPHLLITGSLSLGNFYNLLDPSLLTSTTMEGPLIAGLLFLLSSSSILFLKSSSKIVIFSLVFSLFLLLLFNRRGFIFSSFIALGIFYLYYRSQKKAVLYGSVFLFLLPIFWEPVALFVVQIFKSELLSTMLVRNDTEDLLSATGRAIAWNNVLTLYFEFRPSLFFGFSGGVPADFFLTTDDNGRFLHAHNTFLQLFLESGYLVDILLLTVVIYTLKEYCKENVQLGGMQINVFVILLIFLMSLSGTETMIREIQFSTFVFCSVLLLIQNNSYQGVNRHLKVRYEK